jgi:PAS domain S-box-containing protein
MHGYTVDELIGQPCNTVLAPESRDNVALHESIIGKNCHHVYEAIHMRKDGSRFPVMTDVTVYSDESSKVTFVAATYQDISDRRRMEESLRQTRVELERNIEQRTHALHRTSRRLQRVQDEERRKYARALHDSTGQHLVGLKMNLEILRRPIPDQRRSHLIEDSVHIVDICIDEVRTLSYLLHPPLLDEMGLTSAIRWFVDGFSNRCGIEVKLELPAELNDLAAETELALFRVLQESLTNIDLHSGSRTAEVRLSRTDYNVVLEVRDYGRGISPMRLDRHLASVTPTTIGLPGIRERITELEGDMDVVSGPHGTTVKVQLPIRTPEHPDSASA